MAVALDVARADMDFAALKAGGNVLALAFGVPPMLLEGCRKFDLCQLSRGQPRAVAADLAAAGGQAVRRMTEGLATWFPGANLAIDLDKVPALAGTGRRWQQVSDAKF